MAPDIAVAKSESSGGSSVKMGETNIARLTMRADCGRHSQNKVRWASSANRSAQELS